MNSTVIGRGRVGGGLAQMWAAAGHTVTTLDRDGGDAAGADVIVMAVPAFAIVEALRKVTGLAGQVAIYTCNVFNGRPEGFPSLAHHIKGDHGRPYGEGLLHKLRSSLRSRPSPADPVEQSLCCRPRSTDSDGAAEPRRRIRPRLRRGGMP
ncbi:hypothetical protein [Streptomyces sp. NBC_01361]|uniref:hypothetical protein n=1 Tax=Streptomyces sp. NBC_01361 TaxID=2903838 RepID=UPI002E33CD06|nr:hypothetical protein [Streptomyces sp. NBC_01361]